MTAPAHRRAPRLPHLCEPHHDALATLPRDGRPVGILAEGRGNREKRLFADLEAHGFVARWPGKGWAITEAGIAALDAAQGHAPPAPTPMRQRA